VIEMKEGMGGFRKYVKTVLLHEGHKKYVSIA